MPHLLEIFAGTKSIGSKFSEAGWRVTSVDLRADFEPTICCNALELQPEQIDGRVDLVWASPPCTDYSKARTTAKTPRNLVLSDALVQVGIDMAQHFGAPLFMENPQSMLQHRDVVKDLRMELIDYCKYGEEDWPHIWPKLYRKRTMIFCWGHDWTPARPLCRKDCRGCPDGRKHIENAQRAHSAGKVIPGNRLEELYAIPPALPRELLAWWNGKRTHLLHLLESRKWRKQTHRLNIASSYTQIPRVSAEGKPCRDRKVLEPQQSECTTKGQVWDFVQTMLPPWFPPGEGGSWFCVTVNKNTTCKPHKDRDNLGDVGIMFLGEFEGGALLTETGERYQERGVWHRYAGSKVQHWNEPITAGTKYSVIIHNNRNRPIVFPIKYGPRKRKDAASEGEPTNEGTPEQEAD